MKHTSTVGPSIPFPRYLLKINDGTCFYKIMYLNIQKCLIVVSKNWKKICISFIVVLQPLSHVQLFVTPWTAECQATLSLTLSWSLLKFMSTESVILSNQSILCPQSFTSLCLQSFITSESFPVSWLFSSGSQYAGASGSASILPINIQGWFPLGLTGLISLLFKGLSRVFFSTTVWNYQFVRAQPFLWSNSHLYMICTWLLEKP